MLSLEIVGQSALIALAVLCEKLRVVPPGVVSRETVSFLSISAPFPRFQFFERESSYQEETLYLITNTPPERAHVEQFLFLKRNYWQIENKLHYRKDFVFGEDRSTIRARHGTRNMAGLRNLPFPC